MAMTKDQILKDCVNLYRKYPYIFERMNVTEIEFYGWLESLSFNEIRKANTKIMSIWFVRLIAAQSVWELMSPQQWQTIEHLAPKQKENIQLKDIVRDLKELWRKRIKSKRKGTE